MNTQELTQKLVRHISKPSDNSIVLPNVYVKGSPFESDCIRVLPSRLWVEYEVKVTRADFFNDFKKFQGKAFRSKPYSGEECRHEWLANPDRVMHRRGWKSVERPVPKQFYFVTPAGLIDVETELPAHCGLFEGREDCGWLECVKTAPRLPNHQKLSEAAVWNLAVKAAGRLRRGV